MEQNQIEQGIRLKNLIKALNLNQLGFAKSLDMTQPNISRMVSGEGKVSIEVLNRITGRYKQVNLHWLVTGDGGMFFDENIKRNPHMNELSVRGKGWLEELEERVGQLEKKLNLLIKESESKKF